MSKTHVQIQGQLTIFDYQPKRQINKPNECLGEPCMYCDVEWCSLACLIRRGYIWDRVIGFTRDENGKALRKNIDNRECKKDY